MKGVGVGQRNRDDVTGFAQMAQQKVGIPGGGINGLPVTGCLVGRTQLAYYRNHRCFIAVGYGYPPAVLVARFLVLCGRDMAEFRLLAEGHGNVAPDISLTIDPQ